MLASIKKVCRAMVCFIYCLLSFYLANKNDIVYIYFFRIFNILVNLYTYQSVIEIIYDSMFIPVLISVNRNIVKSSDFITVFNFCQQKLFDRNYPLIQKFLVLKHVDINKKNSFFDRNFLLFFFLTKISNISFWKTSCFFPFS